MRTGGRNAEGSKAVGVVKREEHETAAGLVDGDAAAERVMDSAGAAQHRITPKAEPQTSQASPQPSHIIPHSESVADLEGISALCKLNHEPPAAASPQIGTSQPNGPRPMLPPPHHPALAAAYTNLSVRVPRPYEPFDNDPESIKRRRMGPPIVGQPVAGTTNAVMGMPYPDPTTTGPAPAAQQQQQQQQTQQDTDPQLSTRPPMQGYTPQYPQVHFPPPPYMQHPAFFPKTEEVATSHHQMMFPIGGMPGVVPDPAYRPFPYYFASEPDSPRDGSGESGAGGSESQNGKKARLVWTQELHNRFINALSHLGLKNAVPKNILTLMNVEGMTRENVASHLQKYRLYLKKIGGYTEKERVDPEELQKIHEQNVQQMAAQQAMQHSLGYMGGAHGYSMTYGDGSGMYEPNPGGAAGGPSGAGTGSGGPHHLPPNPTPIVPTMAIAEGIPVSEAMGDGGSGEPGGEPGLQGHQYLPSTGGTLAMPSYGPLPTGAAVAAGGVLPPMSGTQQANVDAGLPTYPPLSPPRDMNHAVRAGYDGEHAVPGGGVQYHHHRQSNSPPLAMYDPGMSWHEPRHAIEPWGWGGNQGGEGGGAQHAEHGVKVQDDGIGEGMGVTDQQHQQQRQQEDGGGQDAKDADQDSIDEAELVEPLGTALGVEIQPVMLQSANGGMNTEGALPQMYVYY